MTWMTDACRQDFLVNNVLSRRQDVLLRVNQIVDLRTVNKILSIGKQVDFSYFHPFFRSTGTISGGSFQILFSPKP